MIAVSRRNIPEDHPVRALFRTFTERGLGQLNLHDEQTIQYVADLLTEFVDMHNVIRVKDDSGRDVQNVFELLQQAGEAMSPELRRDCYKYVGDLTLFKLGLYPESLTYGRHTVSPDFYALQGRRSYHIVAAMGSSPTAMIFQKMSDQFEQCVVGLHWVKRYISDPFYQYMFREFGVT